MGAACYFTLTQVSTPLFGSVAVNVFPLNSRQGTSKGGVNLMDPPSRVTLTLLVVPDKSRTLPVSGSLTGERSVSVYVEPESLYREMSENDELVGVTFLYITLTLLYPPGVQTIMPARLGALMTFPSGVLCETSL